MLHAFNIYPSLFVLTPVTDDEMAQMDQQKEENNWAAETDRYFTSCPQTYWGACIVTASQKQLMVGCANDEKACPVQDNINGRPNTLEPAKFRGSRYTITYIPVLN